MADVRALLRAERSARRITHPNASYTTDGKLSCSLCETLVKSEAQWQSHLHSTQHTLRSQRAQDAEDVRAADPSVGSKKRKAETLEVESPAAQVGKKRVRSGEDYGEEFGPKMAGRHGADASLEAPAVVMDTAPPAVDPEAPADADELEAFERDLMALEAESNANRASAIQSAATISAAPMTAGQLAAQAREEASAQKGKRDQELEDEKEDASRVMQEELEEMEGLEERVKRLRERREALRKGSEAGDDGRPTQVDGLEDGPGEAVGEGSEDDQDDEEDEWNFGGS